MGFHKILFYSPYVSNQMIDPSSEDLINQIKAKILLFAFLNPLKKNQSFDLKHMENKIKSLWNPKKML